MPSKSKKIDHTQLICDFGEISGLFTDSTTLEQFLHKTTDMIAKHMHCNVCSIYLYNDSKQELVLRATHGLNKDYIGNVRLKLGEGLTGLALKELRPIVERCASQNPNFRYFPGLGEEKFESFVAVPIMRGKSMVGAMVIQNRERNYFSEQDVTILLAITSQLANTIEMTRVILSLEDKDERRKSSESKVDLRFIKGNIGSPGFAFAEGIVLTEERRLRSYIENLGQTKYSIDQFYKAVEETEKQLEDLQLLIEKKLSDVASLIFSAQILMLKDQAFIGAMANLIKEGMQPPKAIIQVVNLYVKKFQAISNAYLQERSQDIRDIGKRLLDNLIGTSKKVDNIAGHIVISREMFPSDALKLSTQNVKGIILLRGGVTSHISILVRSLQIPLVIADIPELLGVASGTKIILDADNGNIYVNPAPNVIASFVGKDQHQLEKAKIKKAIKTETRSKDHQRVHLLANINLLNDLKNAKEYKAEGVGLYRTEFPFIVRSDFPSEEEQFVIYEKLITGMKGKEITFRTLDIGGDKILSYFDHHHREKNPYLGMRSIRFSLQHIDIFTHQIRAILRASAQQKVRIMFPMISSVDEFIKARSIVYECMETLKKQNIDYNDSPQIGLMVELPAVVEVINELAQETDFFSIGTNDFIQYMLAVDRTNEKVADRYLPNHPSILRALYKIVQAAIKYDKDVSVCGDMAHEEKYVRFFLGIGLRKFSINPAYIPKIQNAIRKIDISEAEKYSKSILKISKISEINLA